MLKETPALEFKKNAELGAISYALGTLAANASSYLNSNVNYADGRGSHKIEKSSFNKRLLSRFGVYLVIKLIEPDEVKDIVRNYFAKLQIIPEFECFLMKKGNFRPNIEHGLPLVRYGMLCSGRHERRIDFKISNASKSLIEATIHVEVTLGNIVLLKVCCAMVESCGRKAHRTGDLLPFAISTSVC